jgi:hypothetical protein
MVRAGCCCRDGEAMCLACMSGNHEACRDEGEALRLSRLSPVERRLEYLEASLERLATQVVQLTEYLVRERQIGPRP